MNCEYMDQLLALYVGGDLEKERSPLVAAHLQSCAQCARAMDEYAAVNGLLREFEPPMFSQAVYAGIRRQVLNEIEQTSRASAWFGLLSQFFGLLVQPRPVMIGAAVLVVTLTAASYFLMHESRLPQSPQQVVGVQPENPSSSSPSGKPSERRSLAPDVVKRSNSNSRRRQTPVIAVTQPSRLVPTKTVTRDEASADISRTSLARTPIRMELKTSNPNIRMIWFSSPSQASPKETSKGI